ncbi:hypothetical protein [Rhizobium sp. HT1-10]|uniref:hypothetical protein n=1 Tax=Rhizobium sp. HT1-10 TaxID=3111638 RepID=UPI003C19C130
MTDQNRSKKLKRLVAVQRHLEQMAEQELAEATRTRNEVGHSIDQVVDAIGSVDIVHTAFAQQYAWRLGRLTLRDQQLEAMQRLIEMNVLRERTKADRLEEHMLEARAAELRESDDNAVYDIIDQRFASVAPASSKVQKP